MKEMNRHITKDHIQMADKQAYTPLVIRKIQVKTPHIHQKSKIERTDNSKVLKDVEKLDLLNVAGGSINWYHYFGKLLGNSSSC